MTFSFVILGKPLPQRRPIVLRRGFTIDPPESKKAKNVIAKIAFVEMIKQKRAIMEGPVSVSLAFFGADKRTDLDNLIKLCLDAVKGVVWKDDRQVHQLFAIKRDADKESARTLVRIIEQ